MAEKIPILRKLLLSWFRTEDRQLPWRKSYNPYHVWISEIMLQQTQMQRGILYFQRWLKRFPDIAALAEAEEREILKHWEGLGYYARARNLHATAKILHARFGGVIPCDPRQLQELPGIGPYTAAAISSIACNFDIPVVDANVLRVYARIFDIDSPVRAGKTRKEIESLAWRMLPPGQARNFNQALMDFGGLVCLPRSPECGNCVLSRHCLSFLRGTVLDRPVLGSGRTTILIEMATGVLEVEGKLFIQQRHTDDIWGGLWEFPGGRVEKSEPPEAAVVREYLEETGFRVAVCRKITTVTHCYTRYKVILHCFACRLAGAASPHTPQLTAARDYRWVLPQDINQYAFPAGHRKLLEYITAVSSDILENLCRDEEV